MTYLCVLAWRCVGAADVAASIASALFGLTEFRVQSSEFTLAKSRDEHDEDEQVDTDKETDVEDDERWCSRPHRRISRRRLRAHRLRARLRLRRRLQARRRLPRRRFPPPDASASRAARDDMHTLGAHFFCFLLSFAGHCRRVVCALLGAVDLLSKLLCFAYLWKEDEPRRRPRPC